jgi:hypothetical protein
MHAEQQLSMSILILTLITAAEMAMVIILMGAGQLHHLAATRQKALTTTVSLNHHYQNAHLTRMVIVLMSLVEMKMVNVSL